MEEDNKKTSRNVDILCSDSVFTDILDNQKLNNDIADTYGIFDEKVFEKSKGMITEITHKPEFFKLVAEELYTMFNEKCSTGYISVTDCKNTSSSIIKEQKQNIHEYELSVGIEDTMLDISKLNEVLGENDDIIDTFIDYNGVLDGDKDQLDNFLIYNNSDGIQN
ncbi:hypothetical protein cand_034190 [Cryptosporidium andersoni]|uniref:Uncharacterized protein n=1 Tax=Cryptosporidium andersoni TaxID=117008 RepID=A0A1J4MVS2_9CRYT|nr:hypothetical protein cand_034190 [Cryptosporidium andersoni]